MCAVTDEVVGVNFWSFWSGMIDQLGALTKSGLGATWGPEKKNCQETYAQCDITWGITDSALSPRGYTTLVQGPTLS